MKTERIGIAMSGGVDSTAAALLLQQKAEIQGFFMRLAQPDIDDQLKRVMMIAERLDIPLEVIDLQEGFSSNVLEYFANTYFQGLTPNPCMVCNQQVKFGLFQEAIISRGMDRMATGHYARLFSDGTIYHLHDGIDPFKDQSYFLARLNQKQLSRLMFPLGECRKQDMYALVREHGFTDFEGIESQDVCFLSDESPGDYLAARYPDFIRPGKILSTTGAEVGRHEGLFRYTIGQRRGLGIPDSSPWYVSGIDAGANTLIVCKADDLFRTSIRVEKLHWLADTPPDFDKEYTVRIRYSHRGSAAAIQPGRGDTAQIIFHEKQRAVTPGQFAVIYDSTEVLGSGIIT